MLKILAHAARHHRSIVSRFRSFVLGTSGRSSLRQHRPRGCCCPGRVLRLHGLRQGYCQVVGECPNLEPNMRVENYYQQGKRWWPRLYEKGGKHEIYHRQCVFR